VALPVLSWAAGAPVSRASVAGSNDSRAFPFKTPRQFVAKLGGAWQFRERQFAVDRERRRGQHTQFHCIIQFVQQVHVAPRHALLAERLSDGSGMAFLARAQGRRLSFGVSGLLYNSDVLLYDRQSNSLWSQLMEQAITGPMKGTRLTSVPLTHTTWADWKKRYSRTLVLSPETGYARDYQRDPYAGYAQSERLTFEVRAHSTRYHYHPKERVIGVSLGGQHKAYPFIELGRSPRVIHDTLGGRPIEVRFDGEHQTGAVFDSDGHEIPSVIVYWFAWYAFHTDTEVFVAK
jgi:Protein of unknown function (DUF3179)